MLRRSLLIVGALLATGMLCAFACRPIIAGKTSPPVYTREAAVAAVEKARNSPATRWAPATLRSAELALRLGKQAERVQSGRLVFFRDYTPAREGFRTAEERARDAMAEATSARDAARSLAEAAISQASRQVGEAESVAQSVRLARSDRLQFHGARTRLNEARALFKEERYLEAEAHARESAEKALKSRHAGVSLAARYTDADQVRQWRRWAEETIAWSRSTGQHAIVVYKEKNRLSLYDDGKLVRSYEADMGANSLNTKLAAGDEATPEGKYRITQKKGAGKSHYYKALLLNYPNDEDRRRFQEAKRKGLVSRYATPGGLVEIHGEGGRGEDWTRGCVALANGDMDDLFRRVGEGTPVTIVGGDGSGGTFSELARRGAPSGDSGRP